MSDEIRNPKPEIRKDRRLSTDERLLKLLQATTEQQTAIDRILDGKTEAPRPAPTGPLLIAMGPAAALLGVSRWTLFRMVKAGRLNRVEVLPGSFRLRRAELEEIATPKETEV